MKIDFFAKSEYDLCCKKALTFKIAGKASSGNKIAYKLVKANKNIKFDAKTGIVTIKKGTKNTANASFVNICKHFTDGIHF